MGTPILPGKAPSWQRHFLATLPFLFIPPAHAQAPQLNAIFPAGGKKGSTFNVQSIGKNPPGTQWWSDAPGLVVTPARKDQEWTFTLPENTPIGLYQIHTYNEQGRSAVRFFSVGTLNEIREAEPNDEHGSGQVLEKLPICINGRLEKANDVDGYRIVLKTGQTLVGLVEAYVLGSPVDPLVHILNSRGERLFTAMDSRNLDPAFAFQVPEDGEYTLQIMGFAHPPQANVNYTGNANTIYRLHLSTGPVVTHFLPGIAPENKPIKVSLQGYNLPEETREFELTPKHVHGSGRVRQVILPNAFIPIQAVSDTAAAQLETEPNNTRDKATPIQHGLIGGQFHAADDVDRYTLEMTKGDTFQASVWSQRLGLLPDTEITIEDPSGNIVTSNQDIDAQADPRVQWAAKTDGPHQIIVRETMQRSGTHHHYLLEVGRPKPAVSLTMANVNAVTLAAGKAEKIKVTVNRLNGMTNPFILRIDGLPKGIRATEVSAPAKDGEVELTLEASSDAFPYQGMIYPTAWIPNAKTDGADKKTTNTHHTQEVTSPLRGDLKRGTSLLDEAAGIWLTVRP